MQYAHPFGVSVYRSPDMPAAHRILAASYEDAVSRVAGEGLTLVASSRIRGLPYLVAKVWDGHGFRYAYRYPPAG